MEICSSEDCVIIRIKSEISERCITVDDGEKLYHQIHLKLIKGDSVILDFSGVRLFASPFFNTAIGPLLKDYTNVQLNHFLKIENLSLNGSHILRRVIENAQKYYSDSRYKNAVDKVIAENSEGY